MSKVRLYGDTSGYVDLKAPDVAGDVTITLPNTTGPFATETYVDSEIAANALAGIGSNVVSVAKTTSFSTSSTSFVDWTDVTLSFTPSSATAKVLLILSAPSTANSQDFNSASATQMRLMRNATALFGEASSQRGDPAGVNSPLTLIFLDSPATASAVTYKAQVKTNSGTQTYSRGTLTAIEVAA